jgi:hypothetical protein
MQSPAHHRYRFPAHSMKNAHPEGSIANRRTPRHNGTTSHHPVLGAPVALWQIVVFVFINLRIAFSATHLFSQTSALPPLVSKSISKKEPLMTQQTAKSRFINNSARCQRFYPNRRRCRLYATAHAKHR